MEKNINLGAVIENPQTRKVLWKIYTIAGLILLAAMAAIASIGAEIPNWLIMAIAVEGVLAPAMGTLAIANINTKPSGLEENKIPKPPIFNKIEEEI